MPQSILLVIICWFPFLCDSSCIFHNLSFLSSRIASQGLPFIVPSFLSTTSYSMWGIIMLISSSQYVNHAFMHPSERGDPFLLITLVRWSSFPCYLQLYDMTQFYQIQAYIPHLFLLVIGTSFNIFLDWNNFNHLDQLHLFLNHTIIPWVPYKVEFSVRHSLLPVGKPSNEYSNKVFWSSSPCKCSCLNYVWWALY